MIARNTHNPGLWWDEITVDNFAGGGGASLGIERGLGRAVDVAINHDARAVAMHRVNHPHTLHLCQDVWEVDPIEAVAGRPVGVAWFSPDCTFHSKARGGKPIRTKKRRDLAWVVLRWGALVRPRIIMLENVEEFADWGPLTRKRGRDRHPRPCRRRKGRTFRRFIAQLEALGYVVEWRELRACDYGAPTIRKRLFLVARCDGLPIVWPEVTHGRVSDSAGSCDRTTENQKRDAQIGREDSATERKRNGECGNTSKFSGLHQVRGASNRQPGRDKSPRPLKPYRTAAECIDWSIPCPSIFERKRPLADNTLKRIANGIKRYVLDSGDPFIVQVNHHGGTRVHSIDDPLNTVQASSREGKALVMPTLIQTGYGERQGQAPRVPGLHKPLGTVVGTPKHALVSAFIARHFGGMTSRPIDKPLPTTTTRGTQNQVVAAHLTHLYGTNKGGGGNPRCPLGTVTGGGNHAGLVAALLVKYYGCDVYGQGLDEPLHTVPTKERFGLVTVHIDGEPYIITDIGMRMLQPRELFNAQGFPREYVIDHGVDGDGRRVTLTKTEQVKFCGNSVCPDVVEALVRANVPACEQADELTEVCA